MDTIYLLPGEERCVDFRDANGVPKVHYTYCSIRGKLFNCTCCTKDEAQRLCEDWLIKQDRCYINSKKPPRTSPQNGKSPRRYSFIESAFFRWCPFLPQKIVPRFSVPEPVLASRSVPCGSPGKRLSSWSVALQTPHPTP